MTLTNSSKTFRSASSFPHQQYVPSSLFQESQNVNAVPVKVVPVGEPASGSAISSITSNVNNVTLYGEEGVIAVTVVPIRETTTAHNPHSFITSYRGCPEPSMRDKSKT